MLTAHRRVSDEWILSTGGKPKYVEKILPHCSFVLNRSKAVMGLVAGIAERSLSNCMMDAVFYCKVTI
jgi:hypothetical protein